MRPLKVAIICLFVSGCATHSAQYGSTKTVISRQTVNELEKERVPGTHEDAWVEAMYDSVRVPGAIDPKGIYYRKGHTTIYEIRPGKYQKVQYPNRKGQYQRPRQGVLKMMKKTLNKTNICLTLLALSLLPACSSAPKGAIKPETRYIVLDKPAVIPPGVVRYCWEEPMVQIQNVGPGLDADERWYEPAYVAVREVKQGRWRPCRQMASEIKGDTKNER